MKQILQSLKEANIKVFGITKGDDVTDAAINLTEDGNIHISSTPYAAPFIYQLCTWDGEGLDMIPFAKIPALLKKAKELLNTQIAAI